MSFSEMAVRCRNNSLLDLTNFTQEPNCFGRIANAQMARNILMLGMPNDCNWNRDVFHSAVWRGFFHASTVFWTAAFLLFALAICVLIARRHSVDRFKVKTTVAVLLTLAVLGFSRTALCVNMSVALEDACANNLACLVFIRFFDALGFPSLTASYTLVFLTLVLASKVKLGPDCMQRVAILIPFALIHYGVALIFEIVGLLSPGPALFSLLACEAFYTIWGVVVCVTYILVGVRLMRQIRRSIRQTSLIVKRQQKQRLFTLTKKGPQRSQRGAMKMTREVKRHHHRALRKITILTYVSAGLGIAYSLVNVVRLAFNFLLASELCKQLLFEDEVLQDPIVWLVLLNISRGLEILLGILLAYSVTDIEPFVKCFKRICCRSREDAYDLGTLDSLPSGQQIDPKVPVEAGIREHDSEENLLENGRHMTIRLPDEEGRPEENRSSDSSVAVEQIGGTDSIMIPPVIIIQNSPGQSSPSSSPSSSPPPSPPPSYTSHHIPRRSTGGLAEKLAQKLRKTSCPPSIEEQMPQRKRKASCPANMGEQMAEMRKGLSLAQDTYAVIGVSWNNLQEASEQDS